MYRFLCFPEFRKKAVTLSYDDATVYDRKLIAIMQKYGLKGTFNVNSGLFAKEENSRRMTKDAAYKLYKNSGMEVAVHGVMHFSPDEMPDEVIMKEILGDRERLEKMFGTPITGMAYANGSYSDRVVELVKKCGIKYARTCISTENFDIPADWLRMPATCRHADPKLRELTEKFLEPADKHANYWIADEPKLFYLWGHSFEFNDRDEWDIIENFAKSVGGREDVWYATNGEIYDYTRAFRLLEYSVDGRYVYNPTATAVYLERFNERFVIRPGKTVKLNKIFNG